MRRINLAAVTLAVALGSATAVAAQQGPPPQRQRGEHAEFGRRGGPGGPFGGLLRGIELSAEQRTKLAALRAEHGPERRGPASGEREKLQAARERGDTAQLRALRAERHAAMQANREKMIGEVRSILTAQQRTQFDQNVQEMKARMEQGGRRGPGGPRGGR